MQRPIKPFTRHNFTPINLSGCQLKGLSVRFSLLLAMSSAAIAPLINAQALAAAFKEQSPLVATGLATRDLIPTNADVPFSDDPFIAPNADNAVVPLREERLLAHEDADLERQGFRLLRQPPEDFRTLETLTEAIAIGEELEAASADSTLILENYPAISPLLALRLALNTVLERVNVPHTFGAFGSNGQYFVVTDISHRESQIYDLLGNQIAELDGTFVEFRDDGQQLITHGADEKTTYLYDLSGKQLGQFPGVAHAYSKDGQTLITFESETNTTYFYNLTTNQETSLDGYLRSFTASGQRLVVVDEDGSEYLYDFAGNQLATVKGSFLDFSEDGRWFVASGDEETNFLFDQAGKQVMQFTGTYVGSSPDSQYLFTFLSEDVSNEGVYDIYDLAGNKVAEHSGTFLLFDSASQHVAVFSSSDRVTNLYEVGGAQIATVPGYPHTFSDDGKILITIGGNDRSEITHAYHLDTDETLAIAGVFVEFGADGQQFATYDRAASASRIYNSAGSEIAQFPGVLKSFGKDGWVAVSSSNNDRTQLYDLASNRLSQFKADNLTLSPTGDRLLKYSSNDDELNYLYDLSGRLLSRFPGSFRSFSNDGQRLAVTTNQDEIVSIYDTSSGRKVGQAAGYFLWFTETGQRFAVVGSDRVAHLYDGQMNLVNTLSTFEGPITQVGQYFVALSTSAEEQRIETHLLDLDGNEIRQFAGEYREMSVETQRLVTSSFDENGVLTSHLYDLSTGEKLGDLAATLWQLSPDGQWLWTFVHDDEADSTVTHAYDADGTLKAKLPGIFRDASANAEYIVLYVYDEETYYLYDLAGNELAAFEEEFVTFSPDDQQLVFSDYFGDLQTQLYDLESEEFTTIAGAFTDFSPDGQWIVTSSEEADVTHLYNRTTQQTWQTDGSFYEFSQDGQSLVVTSLDEDVTYVLNLSGELLAEYPGTTYTLRPGIDALGVDPDGQQLATVSRQGYVRLFELDQELDDLLSQGCERLAASTIVEPPADLPAVCGR